jgi:hypothetical protein
MECVSSVVLFKIETDALTNDDATLLTASASVKIGERRLRRGIDKRAPLLYQPATLSFFL